MLFGDQFVKNSVINFSMYRRAASQLLKRNYKFPWKENRRIPEIRFRKSINSYCEPQLTFYFYDQLKGREITVLEVCYDHRYEYKPYYITPAKGYIDYFWSVF